MLRILIFISTIVLISGCGSDNQDKPDESTSPFQIVDREAQYLDSYWLPGGRNYAIYENSLAISHNGGVSLLNINESGLVESEIQVSGTGASSIATLENGDIATLMVNHVRINRIESNMFDVIYTSEESPNVSPVIFESQGNCAYWVDRGGSDANYQQLKELCIDSQGQIVEGVRYSSEGWINNIFALDDGSMVVFEELSDGIKISLFNEDFSLVDGFTTAIELFSPDIEFRNGSIFFTGHTAVWQMDVSSSGFSEPQKFPDSVNSFVLSGGNIIAVHDRGVMIAEENFIYSYKLNGDELTAIYRVEVGNNIDALVVYNDLLIVSYSDNVDFEIYKISDLI